MLHQGILPSHSRWGRFLRALRFVVVDEMHAYRGIFGSHVANVLRRLERVVAHHGGEFRAVLCSATIRNPGELANGLTGRGGAIVFSSAEAHEVLALSDAALAMRRGKVVARLKRGVDYSERALRAALGG